MLNGKESSGRRGIRRIVINGHFLDQIQTRLESQSMGSVSYTRAPVERHRAIEDDQGVTVELPALTALQLFYDGILPNDPDRSVTLSIAGRPLGAHYLEWLRGLPSGAFGEPVRLRFVRQPVARKKPDDPNAWLATIKPLMLFPKGDWNPADEYWGKEGEPVEAWVQPLIERGPRPKFEMERVLPGFDPDDPDSDPILKANVLKEQRKYARARQVLEKLLWKDMRCLDAHAHMGNLAFSSDTCRALDHYQRGVQIGELSLGDHFDGVLPWGLIDNRPFLRCLSGMGLSRWRRERYEEAEIVFARLLWMCPSDNLGVRLVLPRVRAGEPWTDEDL